MFLRKLGQARQQPFAGERRHHTQFQRAAGAALGHQLQCIALDFVQARLATVVGPPPEMERFVRRYGVGVVTDGFEPSDITRAIDALTPEAVDAMKAESDRHAAELAREADAHGWREAIDALASRGAERRA